MLAYWLLIAARRILLIIPERMARALGCGAGAAAFLLDRRHRRVARDNLGRAFPEKSPAEIDRIARDSFRNAGRTAVEFFRVSAFLRSSWEERFAIAGEERVREAFRRGKGIIFILAHFGNWEYLAFLPRLLGFRGGAIGQEIKNPAVDGLVKDTREEMGLDLFPKGESAAVVLGYLARNGGVAILADQRARTMAVRASFFGREAPTTAGPAVLARRSGAALLPVFLYPKGDVYAIEVKPEIPVPRDLPPARAVEETTRRIAAVIEEAVRERPDLWLWGHRRWG
jgi:KDO2-lipid IV(A) lauroyltransferase